MAKTPEISKYVQSRFGTPTLHNDDHLLTGLADAIRKISTMISSGASCDDVAFATTTCAGSMLPGAHAIVVEVSEDRQSARIMAATNAPFTVAGQALPLQTDCVLNAALDEPSRVHLESDTGSNELQWTLRDLPDGPNAVLACKALPRTESRATVLILISPSETAARANAVLMTLSELLTALCTGHDAAVHLETSLKDIERAKNEWERTVDALPEVVCLLDRNGNILRANRTVERWGLGDVGDVRGVHIHDLLHKNCTLHRCPLKDAVSLSMAEQASNDYLESPISDGILGRTLIVHTRLMYELPFVNNHRSLAGAVVVISDISALQRAQQELAMLNESLEKRVDTRTAELLESNYELNAEMDRRHATELQLQASRDELADLTQQLINAQEEERHDLSRELHDSLGQSLGAIKYSLERVAFMSRSALLEKPEKELALIIERVGHLIREARSMAMGLRPPVLDDMGAVSAVDWLCRTSIETFSDIDFRIELEVSDEEIPQQLWTPIYRIVQEAINNIVKHAAAKTVLVALKIDNDILHLEVLDDGIGFDSDESDTGEFKMLGKMGRLGMRERANNSNGSLSIDSWSGEGTSVRAEWPLRDIKIQVE